MSRENAVVKIDIKKGSPKTPFSYHCKLEDYIPSGPSSLSVNLSAAT